MFVLNLETGNKARALIDRAGAYDLVTVKNDTKRFSSGFNWSLSKSTEIYKLRLENEKTILGLMSIQEEKDISISAIKIELLEISLENIRGSKKLDRIAGCLIAWACKISFDRGYEGNTFLVPKSNLITHFSSKYGFTHIDISSIARPFGFMIVHGRMSEKLIHEFLNS